MADRLNKQQGYPSLTAREHWGRYSLGVASEVAFILALTLLAFLLAVVALTLW